MKKYVVIEPFFSSELGQLNAGMTILSFQYSSLTWNDKKKIKIFEYSIEFSVFDYGLIFESKEFPSP